MNVIRGLLGLIFAMVVTACVGPLVPVMDMDKKTTTNLESQVRIYDKNKISGQFTIIRPVQATSCMNKLWDSPPSRKDAINQMRAKASLMGGDGITTPICEKTEGTNLAKNCWASITCHATAIEIQPRSVATAPKKIKAVSGTGWPVVGGYVVTNHHVIAGRKTIVLFRTDGVMIPARVVVDDITNDLVLLKPDNIKLLPPALPLANRVAQVGGHVFTVGYPHPDMMGKEPKLTDGIINARTGIKNDPRVYQVSVQLQSGNSGGPLINMRGEVVGVTTSKISAVKVFKWTGDLPQNVNYAVKVGYVRTLLSSVDPSNNVQVLPARKDDLAALAKRIEGSVLMVIAQ